MNDKFEPDEKLIWHHPNGRKEDVVFAKYVTLHASSMQTQPSKAIVKAAKGRRMTVPIGDLSRPE